MPTYSYRCVVVERGKQAHHCKPRHCNDHLSWRCQDRAGLCNVHLWLAHWKWRVAEAKGLTELPAGRRAGGFLLLPSQMKKICKHLPSWIHPTLIMLPHLPLMSWRKHAHCTGRLWTLILLNPQDPHQL